MNSGAKHRSVGRKPMSKHEHEWAFWVEDLLVSEAGDRVSPWDAGCPGVDKKCSPTAHLEDGKLDWMLGD